MVTLVISSLLQIYAFLLWSRGRKVCLRKWVFINFQLFRTIHAATELHLYVICIRLLKRWQYRQDTSDFGLKLSYVEIEFEYFEHVTRVQIYI